MQVMIDPLLVFAATFDTDIKIAIMYLFLCYPTMSCNDIVLMTGEKKKVWSPVCGDCKWIRLWSIRLRTTETAIIP